MAHNNKRMAGHFREYDSVKTKGHNQHVVLFTKYISFMNSLNWCAFILFVLFSQTLPAKKL